MLCITLYYLGLLAYTYSTDMKSKKVSNAFSEYVIIKKTSIQSITTCQYLMRFFPIYGVAADYLYEYVN